ncbi:hypothetical protein SANTM175S_05618 [Streptomyces antimycoticus]
MEAWLPKARVASVRVRNWLEVGGPGCPLVREGFFRDGKTGVGGRVVGECAQGEVVVGIEGVLEVVGCCYCGGPTVDFVNVAQCGDQSAALELSPRGGMEQVGMGGRS